MVPLLLVSLLVHESAWDLLQMQNFISLECLLTARYGYVNAELYLFICTWKASFMLKTETSFSVLEISAWLLANASAKNAGLVQIINHSSIWQVWFSFLGTYFPFGKDIFKTFWRFLENLLLSFKIPNLVFHSYNKTKLNAAFLQWEAKGVGKQHNTLCWNFWFSFQVQDLHSCY